MNARAVVCVVLVILLAASAAEAQTAQQREAAEHFDRGTAFFNEGRYDASLAEFQRAYELAPAHQVLYNLGRVHAALGHAVEATDAFDRYLREAQPGQITDARRAEVQRMLETQRARVGFVDVSVNVEGAMITVDGVDAATAPLAQPIRLSAGSHVIGARAPGYEEVRHPVQIAGRVNERLSFELRRIVPERGTLRILSTLRDVEVTVDGTAVGRTPIASTVPVPAGRHVVVASRPGYEAQRFEVDVEDGAEVEVRVDMEEEAAPDAQEVGTLRLRLPDAPNQLKVDGEARGSVTGSLLLPGGVHELRIDVADREPWTGEVNVPAGGSVEIVPPLRWTVDERLRRLEEADARRALGRWVTIGGAALFVAGGALFFWNEGEISDTDARARQLQAQFDACETAGWPASCDGVENEVRELSSQQDTQDALQVVTLIGAGLGLATTITGLVLWLGAPSEEDIDEAAHAALRLRLVAGPGRIGLTGSF